VILWSIGNEVDYPNDPYVHHQFESMTGNNDAGKTQAERKFDINRPDAGRLTEIAGRLIGWVKECDGSRPVTAGLAYPEMSTVIGYMQALDAAGYNYKEHLYEEHHAKYPDHVIYGSENGHGWDQWAAVRDNDYICGQFLWTGIDYLGEARGWPVRASGAGLIDLAGFKKDRWYHRKAMWSGESFTKLFARYAETDETAKRWRPSHSHWNFREGELLNVFCYTNCDSGELYLNGERIAEGVSEKGVINFGDIPYASGTLEAVCGGGGLRYTDTLVTSGEPERISVTAVQGGSDEAARFEIELCDRDGIPAAHREEEIRVTVTGGKLLGLESGSIADLTPYSSDTRKTNEGRLAAYVRKSRGAAAVYIESPEGRFEGVKILI
jgi:hypothetical protein